MTPVAGRRGWLVRSTEGAPPPGGNVVSSAGRYTEPPPPNRYTTAAVVQGEGPPCDSFAGAVIARGGRDFIRAGIPRPVVVGGSDLDWMQPGDVRTARGVVAPVRPPRAAVVCGDDAGPDTFAGRVRHARGTPAPTTPRPAAVFAADLGDLSTFAGRVTVRRPANPGPGEPPPRAYVVAADAGCLDLFAGAVVRHSPRQGVPLPPADGDFLWTPATVADLLWSPPE